MFKRKSGEMQPGGGGEQDWNEWMAQRLPPQAQDAYRQVATQNQQARAQAPSPDHFVESLERAAAQRAPKGRLRGVARMTAGEQERADVEGQAGSRATDIWHDVVLEIHVPGRAPYEVRRGTLKLKRFDALGAGYPVSVDAGDPDSIEILWKEMPDEKEAIGQRVAEGMQGAGTGMAATNDQALLASLNAVSDPQQKAELARRLREMGHEIPPEAGV